MHSKALIGALVVGISGWAFGGVTEGEAAFDTKDYLISPQPQPLE